MECTPTTCTAFKALFPQSSFYREMGLIYAILLRKLFLEVTWKYIVKSSFLIIVLLINTFSYHSMSFKSNIYIIISWLCSSATTHFHPSSPTVAPSPLPNQSLSVCVDFAYKIKHAQHLSSYLFSAWLAWNSLCSPSCLHPPVLHYRHVLHDELIIVIYF